MSAPTCSAKPANSFMKEIFMARKALAAYLISSALVAVVVRFHHRGVLAGYGIRHFDQLKTEFSVHNSFLGQPPGNGLVFCGET